MTQEELKGEEKLLDHCPLDCEYDQWTSWLSQCPSCYGGASGTSREWLANFKLTRYRIVKTAAAYGGKECGDNPEYDFKTCGDVLGDDLQLCPDKKKSVAYYGAWEAWQNCKGECGKPGTRRRIRRCIPGEKTDECPERESPEEEQKCVTFCPSSKIS